MEDWQNTPPPSRNSRYDWPEIMARLRKRPGRWLLVREQGTRSIQSAVKRGRIAAIRDDTRWVYDVRTRNTNGGRADIWMSARRRTREETDADGTAESGD